MSSFRATVFGALKSKANSRRNFGPGRFSKSQGALDFLETFLIQAKTWDKANWPITDLVILTARIFYPSHRNDLDEQLLMDCIQKAGIIQNDRQIHIKYIFGYKDKDNPRVDFWIDQLDFELPPTIEELKKAWKFYKENQCEKPS